MPPINLLVTLDEAYVPPLRTMLHSLFYNNPGEAFEVFALHDGLSAGSLDALSRQCARHGSRLSPLAAEPGLFADAPVFRYYTTAMYYRLLAFSLLPPSVDRALYLDPDTLVINAVRPLYDTDLCGSLYAACMHTTLTGLVEQVNRARLKSYTSEGYFNSGVLLMDAARLRRESCPEDVFAYVRDNRQKLILPDQDVLNGLYGDRVLPLDDSLYNYHAYRYETYRMASKGVMDVPWVMRHSVILHFCGASKPWQKNARGRFNVLHRHYAALAEREDACPAVSPESYRPANYTGIAPSHPPTADNCS